VAKDETALSRRGARPRGPSGSAPNGNILEDDNCRGKCLPPRARQRRGLLTVATCTPSRLVSISYSGSGAQFGVVADYQGWLLHFLNGLHPFPLFLFWPRRRACGVAGRRFAKRLPHVCGQSLFHPDRVLEKIWQVVVGQELLGVRPNAVSSDEQEAVAERAAHTGQGFIEGLPVESGQSSCRRSTRSKTS